MKNIRIIKQGIDVSKILNQVLDNEEDWHGVQKFENIAGKLNTTNFIPITIGMVMTTEHNIKDSELQQNTIFYDKYSEMVKWLNENNCGDHARAAFFKLIPGGKVGWHIDDGKYYLTKDRYHLSLQGTYKYEVEDEHIIVQPGTFFWFNNKKYHQATNVGMIDRITFVFDVPKSNKNP